MYESLQGKPSRGSCTKIFSDPSSRSFFDDCVKFSVRSWLEVLEFLFTDVFLNAVRASLPGMIVSIFLFEKVESRAAFDKPGGRPPLYLGRTCQADRSRYAYLVFWFLKGCQSDMLATTFFIPA